MKKEEPEPGGEVRKTLSNYLNKIGRLNVRYGLKQTRYCEIACTKMMDAMMDYIYGIHKYSSEISSLLYGYENTIAFGAVYGNVNYTDEMQRVREILFRLLDV